MKVQSTNVEYSEIKYVTRLKVPVAQWKITSPDEIPDDLLETLFGDDIIKQESMYVLYLSGAKVVRAWENISKGNERSTVVPFKSIITTCSRMICDSVIVLHNHPSGTREFSQADHMVAKRIAQALDFIDSKLIDFAVITQASSMSSRRYEITSMAYDGILPSAKDLS